MPLSERTDPIERPRLEGLRRPNTRLTVLCAGPGFGKSTLMRQWAKREPAAVYSLTSADRSVPVLAQGLVDALRLRVPALVRYLPPVAGSALGEPAAVASELARALAVTLRRPFRLLLDDVDEVAGSDGARLVEALVRQAPESLRIIVAGRDMPPFPTARLRAAGEAVQISAPDLAFTPDETAAVLATAIPDASAHLADDVHRLTGGWPVGVRLVAETIRESPPGDRSRVLDAAGRRGGTLFRYLAEEVIGREVEEDRELLRAMATVEEWSIEMWEDLGVVDVRRRVDHLAERGVYFGPGEPSKLVPLVADYLRSDLPLPAGDRRRLLGETMRWHRSRLDSRRALAAALAAGDTESLSELVLAHGEEVLAGGGARLVLAAVSRLPEPVPVVVRRLHGEALQMVGDWDAALDVLGELAAGSGQVDPAVAWRLGLIHHMRGEIGSAVAVYERGDRNARPADAAMLLGWWASAVWLTGDAEACRLLAGDALRLARAAGDDRALANAYTVEAMLAALDGDRGANEAYYLRALDHAERARDVLQQIRIHSNRGSRFFEEGSYLESIDETSEALRLAELTDIVVFRALTLLNLGQARLHVGMIEEAAADFTGARDLWDRLGSRQAAYALVGLGDVHRIRGDRVLARALYEEAVALSEPVGDVQGLVPALAGLSELLRDEDPAAAAALAARATDAGATLHAVPALCALGRARLACGDRTGAAEAAEEAVRLAGRRRDRAGLAESLELAAETDPRRTGLLDEAEALWDEIGDPLGAARVALARARFGDADVDLEPVAGTLGRLGARSVLAEVGRLVEARASRRPSPVRIETLGGFRVLVEGDPVPAAAWQSKKARDALKVLLARRGRPVHREELMELLWPGEDPGRSANRLSVALSVVRSVLDPGKVRDPDTYVVGDRTSVGLAMDRLDVDVESFLTGARRGLDLAKRAAEGARVVLEQAESLYRGSFLEEDPYEDWAIPLREEARVAYLAVARALAALASGDGDTDAACRYHLRILQLDPYDEAAHLGLVAEMKRGGRHGEARRLYREYCVRMADLDVEAAPFP